jgi:hypothetical protein
MQLLSKITVFIVLVSVLSSSCTNDATHKVYIDESKLKKTEVKIYRYGKTLFELDTSNFLTGVNNIQDEFSLFLGSDTMTDAKIAPLYEYVTDTQLISIGEKVIKEYPDLTNLENTLSDAYARYNYFFSDSKSFITYTYISDLYFENSIIVDDSIIIIALDVYLGTDFTKYRSLGLPNYKIRRMTSDNIAIDVMKQIYNTAIDPHIKQKTLIDRMVSAGKLLYFLDAVLPDTPDSLKVGYTSKQVEWINNNGSNVWAFLVSNKLFYSADFKIQSNFIQDGPFTSGFSNESPPRIGVWVGWQIVRNYMLEHPEVSLSDLINNKDLQLIFNQSGYKP